MCGRYTLITNIDRIAEAFGVAPTLEAQPRYNIAPTQDIVTIVNNGNPHLSLLRWGLIPAWAKDLKMMSASVEKLPMISAKAPT